VAKLSVHKFWAITDARIGLYLSVERFEAST
jgi:hypothetical protein